MYLYLNIHAMMAFIISVVPVLICWVTNWVTFMLTDRASPDSFLEIYKRSEYLNMLIIELRKHLSFENFRPICEYVNM